MTHMLKTAIDYARSGLSVFPVKPQCKGPRGRWKEYQQHIADDEQIKKWFDTKSKVGICVIAGEVSGGIDHSGVILGLEFLDCDDTDVLQAFLHAAKELGIDEILNRLPTERTPRGGQHWGWRCEKFSSSIPLAQRDISIGNLKRIKTLIETRGEGGACTVAPTPAGIHPDFPERSYDLLSGSWTEIPTITINERQTILDLAMSFNEYIKPNRVREKSPVQRGPVIQGERPGDRLNAEADRNWWQGLLERHGWKLVHYRGDVDYWQRPGKADRDKSVSATYGSCGDYFYVFSTNAPPFDAMTAYKPFAALSYLDYEGDFKACAKSLQPRYASVHHQNGEHTDHESKASTIDAALAAAIEQEEANHVYFDFDLTEKRKVKETLGNYVKMFSMHSDWKGRLSFNTFARREEIDGEPMTKKHRIDMGVWACEQYRLDGRYRNIRDEAIYYSCVRHSYDPLMDYINGLPKWDGHNRLDVWMPLWCGSPDDELSAWVGRMLITQMVIRALIPGSIGRYVVILQGEEGTGKSRLVMTLGHPWAITFDMSMDQKEAHMAIQGVWTAELAELDTLRRTTEARLKSFISQTTSSFVPKFSNDREDVPRRTVFIGTTNENEILVGETGNTRFLPIKTGVIDLARVAENREQLFSEAKSFLLNHIEDWWIEPESLRDQIQKSREDRHVINVYEETLSQWLFDMGKTETSWPDIAQNFLQIEKRDWKDKSLQMQIASALRLMKWKSSVKRDGRRIRRVWVKPPENE